MEELLAKINANDTAVIREGTVQLKEALKNPESLASLCETMQISQKPQIRQMAAIILKKRFGKLKYWSALPPHVQEGIKNALLKTLIAEPEKFVKNSVVEAIGIIVYLEDKSKSGWPDLSHFLQKYTTSENQNERELGFYALSILTSVAPEQFIQHIGSFSILFNSVLSNTKEQGSTVAFYAIKSLTNFIQDCEDRKEIRNIYGEILPKVIMSIAAMSTKRPDRASEAMDFIYELSDSKCGDLLNPKMKQIVGMCLDFIREPTIKADVQIKAFALLGILIQSKMKVMLKMDLLVPMLHVILKAMCEKPANDEGEEDYFSSDPDDETILTSACESLDDIALNVDAELLIPHINEFVERGLKGTDPYIQKACYLAMGIVTQGCEIYIKENCLAQFIKMVMKGVTADKAVVRNAALFALGQFADYLQPEVNQFASDIMPLLLLLLEDLEKRGQHSSIKNTADRIFFPLERCLENLEENIDNTVLNHLVSKLIILSRPPFDNHVRQLAIEAIGTLANSIHEKIVPYFSSIMDLVIKMYLSNPVTAENANLQVESLDTMGNLIRNINMETFETIGDYITKVGLGLLQTTEDPDLRKSCYGLFAAMSSVLKDRISPLLPTVMEYIISSIRSQEGTVTIEKDDDEEIALNIYESDDDDEEDDDDDDDIEIENDFVEEKEESCLALKELAEHTGESFFPYLETCYVEVLKLLDFPSDEVKMASACACFQFAISFTNINTPEGQQAAHQVITNLINIGCMKVGTEDDKSVVINMLECFQNFLEQIGSKVNIESKEKILSCIKDILLGKTECQSEEDEDEYDDLIDAALDLIPSLGKSLTPDQFSNYFSLFIPLLKDRLEKSGDDPTKRSNVLGSLAECLSPLGLYVNTLMSPFLPYILCLTKDTDSLVRNNSVYFLGEFAFHGKETAVSNYPDILNALSGVLSTEKNTKVLDNVCSSLAKLILSNPSAVNLDSVVPALIENLPLKEDFIEDIWVYRSLVCLYQLGDKNLLRFIVHLIKCAADTLHSHSPDQETKEVLINFIQMCYRDFPSDFNVAASQLPQEIIDLLQQVCAA